MPNSRLTPWVVFATLASACSSESEPSVQYEDVSGIYAGALADTNQFDTFDGTLRISLWQSGKELGGTYELSGRLTGSYGELPVDQTGAIVGVVEFPSPISLVSLSFFSPECENQGNTVHGGLAEAGDAFVLASGTVVACVGVFPHPIGLASDSLARE